MYKKFYAEFDAVNYISVTTSGPEIISFKAFKNQDRLKLMTARIGLKHP